MREECFSVLQVTKSWVESGNEAKSFPILDELAFCDLAIVNSVFSLYMLHVKSCVHAIWKTG